MSELGGAVRSRFAGRWKGVRPLTVVFYVIASLLAVPHEATSKPGSSFGKVCVTDTRQRVAGLVGIMVSARAPAKVSARGMWSVPDPSGVPADRFRHQISGAETACQRDMVSA